MMKYPISRYLNVQQAYWPSFSADGKYLAFLSNMTGVPQVWLVEAAAESPAWPVQLTFGADRVLGVWFAPVVAGESGRLIFARDAGGNENAQLFLLDVEKGVETCLTAGYEGAMHTFGTWSADGEEILFAANRRDPALFDLYRQRIGEEAVLVWQSDGPGFLFKMGLAPDGRTAVIQRGLSSFRDELWEVELASGQARLLTPAEEEARYADVSYAPDGRSLYLLTDLNADFLYVGRLDVATLDVEVVAEEEWDCELLEMSPDGRRLVYALNEDGAFRLCLLDVASGETRRLEPTGGVPGVIGQFDMRMTFSADSQRLAFSFTSPVRTSDVFVWEVETDKVRRVTRSSHGGLPAEAFTAPRLVRYPTFDELKIPAWYYVPKGGDTSQIPNPKSQERGTQGNLPSQSRGQELAPTRSVEGTQEGGKWPAVVLVHGGPEGQTTAYFHFLIQFLVNNGFAVLATNVRGSTGYGKAYSHLDDVNQRMDSVADLAHAAYWLQQQPEIDGERLVVYGGSYGGFMVLSALTTYPELWAAGVCLVGISNFVTFLENTSGYRRAHREAEYGSLERDREFLESIAPINHIDKLSAPLMVIHGANDPRVPLSEAEQMVAALEKRGVPVEFLVFDDEGHGVVKLKNKLVAFPAVIKFLEKYV
jgi:dipeptidyl aminopeptidase/acylaminoacyl peptidase